MPQPSPRITQPPTASPQASPEASPTIVAPQPSEEPPAEIPSPATSPEPVATPIDKQEESDAPPKLLPWIAAAVIALLLAGISLLLVRKRSPQPNSAVPPIQPDDEKESEDRSQNSGEVSYSPPEFNSPNSLGGEANPIVNSEFSSLNSSVDFSPVPGTVNQANGSNKPHLDITLEMHPDSGNQTLRLPNVIPSKQNQSNGIGGTLRIDLDIALATPSTNLLSRQTA